MKFVDEYRDRATVETLTAAIRSTVRHPWTIMEICGGQTHALVEGDESIGAARHAHVVAPRGRQPVSYTHLTLPTTHYV